MGQREDAGYDDEGVDISVGVGVGTVVGVGVDGQGVSLGVGLSVSLVVASPPFPRLLESLSEIWKFHDFNYHLPS